MLLCLLVCRPVYLIVDMPICLLVCLPVCLLACLIFCTNVHFLSCLFSRPLVCFSARLPACLAVWLPVCLLVCLLACLPVSSCACRRSRGQLSSGRLLCHPSRERPQCTSWCVSHLENVAGLADREHLMRCAMMKRGRELLCSYEGGMVRVGPSAAFVR